MEKHAASWELEFVVGAALGHGQGYTPGILTLKLDGDGEGTTRQGVDDGDGERGHEGEGGPGGGVEVPDDVLGNGGPEGQRGRARTGDVVGRGRRHAPGAGQKLQRVPR
ncbi:hypothetical protein Zm00014a_031609 [Zea mays]|uniref:Uncharacterized protein n=1 Tax=Zea mays TaxID=4577 RepID=A0A317YEC3_MAIZE|nr:hypothetical protein Zm00014a_031609 [Zea mays]